MGVLFLCFYFYSLVIYYVVLDLCYVSSQCFSVNRQYASQVALEGGFFWLGRNIASSIRAAN
ncbi:MAG: hypothetical protein UV59_C0024G0004 [Candidatus Gottesmanbacteria bacterium GW2011_GWA1_43_11]|uniref:Uncharacterized protein n=1 Tax=Candidatus Gottesmanbacteria bacterium GW2011_GWA1_43_11 TaxID=1618436 RepID=A0A0G1FBK0_9BACT|nr:MAG: hypothetical protein UV59_C0024G0004 [Candidatus Gottesmanbacteria bacterium GW2011_GWA1_43_11]